MIANYHTHTFRCGHAIDTEREYVENAIRGGLKILGFSDHSPKYYSPVNPMTWDQLEDYVDTVLALKKEYEREIEIHLGLEIEYYPSYFWQFMEKLSPYPMEYLILSQHFVGREKGDCYCGTPTSDPIMLERYCELIKEGMATGCFTYIGHPDLIHFTGEDRLYKEKMRDLVRIANQYQMPLEINLLGLETGRQYPSDRFLRIVGEEGGVGILASDAHSAEDVYKPHVIEKGLMLAQKHKVTLVETVELRKPHQRG